ncbi:MAG TPA: hypothetical protein VEF76_00500 [Patescibacteria group bacterium]|nr:hypothetical protein [Patescibacteria group bacterium]
MMLLPEWARFVLAGIAIFALMASTSVILARAGRSPYWALLVVIPYMPVVLIWLFAFARWPNADRKP